MTAKLSLAVQTIFVRKRVRMRTILQKVSAQQITVWPSKVTHRLDRSFIYGEVSSGLLKVLGGQRRGLVPVRMCYLITRHRYYNGVWESDGGSL